MLTVVILSALVATAYARASGAPLCNPPKNRAGGFTSMGDRSFEAATAAKCDVQAVGSVVAGQEATLKITSDSNILGFLVTAKDQAGATFTTQAKQGRPSGCTNNDAAVTHSEVQNAQSIDLKVTVANAGEQSFDFVCLIGTSLDNGGTKAGQSFYPGSLTVTAEGGNAPAPAQSSTSAAAGTTAATTTAAGPASSTTSTSAAGPADATATASGPASGNCDGHDDSCSACLDAGCNYCATVNLSDTPPGATCQSAPCAAAKTAITEKDNCKYELESNCEKLACAECIADDTCVYCSTAGKLGEKITGDADIGGSCKYNACKAGLDPLTDAGKCDAGAATLVVSALTVLAAAVVAL